MSAEQQQPHRQDQTRVRAKSDHVKASQSKSEQVSHVSEGRARQ